MKTKYLENSRKSIVLMLLLVVSYSLIYMTKNCYTAAMASIVEEGIMTKSETGLISAVFYLVYAPFQIIGGIAADRLSPKWLITLGTLGGAIANILIYFTNSYIAMIAIWGFNAVVQFGVWPSIFKITTTELMPNQRTAGIFSVNSATAIGLFISYAMAVFISDWKDNFLYSAIILLIISVGFYFAYTALEKSMKHEDIQAPEPEKAKKKSQGRFSLIFKSGVPLLLLTSFTQNMINLGIKGITPVMLVENYKGVTASIASGLNIILVLATPIGMLLSCAPFFRRITTPLAISIFTMATIPLLIVVLFIGKINVALIVATLAAIIVFTSATQLSFSYISRAFEKYGCVGTMSGLFNCASSLGIVAWNYGFTKLADSYGWGVTTKAWVIIMLLSLSFALISIPIWKRFIKKVKTQ